MEDKLFLTKGQFLMGGDSYLADPDTITTFTTETITSGDYRRITGYNDAIYDNYVEWESDSANIALQTTDTVPNQDRRIDHDIFAKNKMVVPKGHHLYISNSGSATNAINAQFRIFNLNNGSDPRGQINITGTNTTVQHGGVILLTTEHDIDTVTLTFKLTKPTSSEMEFQIEDIDGKALTFQTYPGLQAIAEGDTIATIDEGFEGPFRIEMTMDRNHRSGVETRFTIYWRGGGVRYEESDPPNPYIWDGNTLSAVPYGGAGVMGFRHVRAAA